MSMTVLDTIFIGLAFAICVRVTVRGFIREFFSAAAFIIAAFTGITFYPFVNGFITLPVQSPISGIISFFLLFIGVFILIKSIQVFLSGIFNNEILGGLDKALGFFLGIAEAIGIITVLIVILQNQTYIDLSKLLNKSMVVEFLTPAAAAVTTAIAQLLQLFQKTAGQAVHSV